MLLVLTEHISVKNSMPDAGLEPVKAFCSDLHSEVELDHLRSLEIKNRVICRAISL